MKKNSFLTFLFSLIPGCGLMYLGYMKKGLQTMLMFAVSGYLAAVSADWRMEWLMVFFIILLPVIWFYQMFDSMHTISFMKRMEIEVPADDDFFIPFTALKPHTFSTFKNSMISKAIGIILILGGSYKILFGILDYMYSRVKPQIVRDIINPLRELTIPVVISLVLISIGVKLIIGSKPKNKLIQYILDDEDEKE